MQLLLISSAVLLFTLLGEKLFLVWTLKKQILDVPNERSSHNKPTPVGGGIVIVIVSLAAFLLFLVDRNDQNYWSYFFGAGLVAIISWLDDLYGIPVVIRFICHSMAAVSVIWGIGIIQDIHLPIFGSFHLGDIIYVFWYLWIVWLINAYNFMDGIDGLAGIQAFTAGVSWACLGYLLGIPEAQFLGLIIAFSNLGFLIFNWPPARLFMGDVGSAFLGYTFAVFPLFLAGRTKESGSFLLVSVLFVWLFVFDTIRTFFLRLLRREAVWKAHRRHLYQQLVIKGVPHRTVTVLYGLLALVISTLTILRLYFGVFNDLFLYLGIGLISAGLVLFTHFYKNREVG